MEEQNGVFVSLLFFLIIIFFYIFFWGGCYRDEGLMKELENERGWGA